MADRIKGITVQIGGDTTGLDKALKGTNKQIKDTAAQLRDVERLLKLDPTNVKLLAQKQRLLKSEIGQTNDKLKALKDAEKQVQAEFKKGNATREQYDALQREIIETEQALQKLEDRAKGSNVALAAIGANAEKFAGAAENIKNKTAGISTAAAGAVAGLGAMAVKAGVAADDLNTLSKQSGFGTDTIQKWQYAADRMDVDVDTIIKSAQKMKRNMNSTSKETIAAFEKLGVSVRDESGNFRDAETVFNESVAALSGVESETERDILAMQIFGRSADEMAGFIDDGGAALKAMGEEAEAAGLILSQDALDGANAFNDGIDTLKAKATQAFFASGAALGEKLLPIMDKLVEKISGLLEWIGSLDGDTIALIGTIALVVAAISPIAGIIGTISTAIAFLAANPIALIIAAIVGLVALIAANWDKLKEIFNGIAEKWRETWEKVKTVFHSIIDAIVAGAKKPLNDLIGLLNGAINAINSLINGFNGISIKMPKWLGGGSFSPNIPTIPNIPYLAKGGILSQGSAVVGEAGPELLTMAGGRAVVQPLTSSTTQNNLGGVNINIYTQPGQNARGIAQAVSYELENIYQARRSAYA